MTKTREIIQRAYRKAGIGALSEDIGAEMLAEGLGALNAMMHGWKLRGVDLEHADLAATDDFSLDPEYHEGTVYLLASRLSPDYVVPASFDADDWFRTFQMHNATIEPVDMDQFTRMTAYYTNPKRRI